ncbi:MAG: glutamate 5-kinase [Chloroherpetonaceae bacterium]|nr:glutamate 5-kinase [Chloroherpetonaceae bacterium]
MTEAKKHKPETVVIKIGTNVITGSNGLLDLEVMEALTADIAAERKKGNRLIMVSSGAMGAGRSLLTLPEKSNPVSVRQILASIGQVKLIHHYSDLFEKHHLLCAQVLATKEDFRDRRHYLNMKHCFEALLEQGIIPIVNENDVVSVTELMFTDNDELAGLIAAMMNADSLMLLTSVEGIYSGSPNDPNSKVISKVEIGTSSKRSPIGELSTMITSEKSQFGRGGMQTKFSIASKLAKVGIRVYIANGKKRGMISDLLKGKELGTTFIPVKKTSGVKKWVATSESGAKAKVIINRGASEQLKRENAASSLLPIGVIRIEGTFQKGDIIKIESESGEGIGVGVAQYGSDIAASRLGKRGEKPLVHYNYLYLT